LGIFARAATPDGLSRIAELVHELEAERVVVGLPLTLRGERGSQAVETTRFVEALRAELSVPVDVFDERFTTALAARDSAAAPEDARAAAHLLTGYLSWFEGRVG
jgi:putative Holliday junction resolvase